MVLARSLFALTLLSGSLAHAAAPASPAPALTRPAEAVVAARIPVTYRDVYALAGVLKDIFAVHPVRGDVRAILSDRNDSVLVVFATPTGHAEVRRVLAGLLPGPP